VFADTEESFAPTVRSLAPRPPRVRQGDWLWTAANRAGAGEAVPDEKPARAPAQPSVMDPDAEPVEHRFCELAGAAGGILGPDGGNEIDHLVTHLVAPSGPGLGRHESGKTPDSSAASAS